MGHLLKEQISASWLAQRLGLEMFGEDTAITNVSSLHDLTENALFFLKDVQMLTVLRESPVIIASEIVLQPGSTTLLSKQPRFDFIKSLALIQDNVGFLSKGDSPDIHPSVQIGQQVVIEKDVSIGENCVIGHHVVIRAGTKIGKNCYIQSGAVIGEDGFGYERDEKNIPVKMVHLGGVKIGNNVLIGANTTICQGTLTPTIIEDDVKIDNLVHIAHNCHIKNRSMIIACAEISGGVTIEEDAWIAPNVSIRQKLTIGMNALVGIGSVVVKNVLENTVVLGNPAKQRTEQ